MKGYILKINNKIKGVYTCIDDIMEFLNEVVHLIETPFKLDQIQILIFKLNTPILEKELTLEADGIYYNNDKFYLKNNVFKIYKNIVEKIGVKSKVITKKILINKSIKKNIQVDKINEELLKKKKEINHKLNLFKKEKEKIEESRNIYDSDIQLYNKFKDLLKHNDNFKIPELFQQKYVIFDDLTQKNKLSWENFNEIYNANEFSSYNSLFVSQDAFLNKINTDIDFKKDYSIDLEIYNKIKYILESGKTYNIPDIFKEKYKIFARLDLNNNLSYQNFIKKYNNDISDSSYESDSSED